MSKFKEIIKNNEKFNELQAQLDEQNKKLLRKLENFNIIHDQVARKILIGRSYTDYLNYRNHINKSEVSNLFLSKNIKITRISGGKITLSFTEPKRDYYWRGVYKTFIGGDFTKNITVEFLLLDDRAIAKLARIQIYGYLKNIEDEAIYELGRNNSFEEGEIHRLEQQLKALKSKINNKSEDILNHKNLRKRYHSLLNNKLTGGKRPGKNLDSKHSN